MRAYSNERAKKSFSLVSGTDSPDAEESGGRNCSYVGNHQDELKSYSIDTKDRALRIEPIKTEQNWSEQQVERYKT